MQKLVRGLHKFQTEVVGQQKEFYKRLADGQAPETLFITCSDSRVNPNLLTQTGPGDLFIVRNAGNIVPPYVVGGGEAASIEYAVVALGVKDVVVCGHSHCGAMKAVLEGGTEGLPAVHDWLRHASTTKRIMKENYTHLEGKALLTAAVEENVLVQLEQLRTHPSIAARMNRGELHLHGWVYKIETGEVFSYDPEKGEFLKTNVEGYVPKPFPGRRGFDHAV